MIKSECGEHCLHYPEHTMGDVYGPLWRSKHPNYDKLWREMKKRLKEKEERSKE